MAQQFFILGCGKMGSAMLNGWLEGGASADYDFIIIDPYFDPANITTDVPADKWHIFDNLVDCVKNGFKKPDIMLLSVKPQMMQDALHHAKDLDTKDCSFISIAAGLSLAKLTDMIGAPHIPKIIRSMPNTPAAIAKGMTALIGNEAVTSDDIARAASLLSVCGKVVELEEESQLDAVTALSGSGPAYIFLLAEAMTQAGIALGLSQALAQTLATQTVYGAGCLLDASDQPASILRENVTSKGGTTAAALDVLMAKDGMQDLLTKAMAQAHKRSQELGK